MIPIYSFATSYYILFHSIKILFFQFILVVDSKHKLWTVMSYLYKQSFFAFFSLISLPCCVCCHSLLYVMIFYHHSNKSANIFAQNSLLLKITLFFHIFGTLCFLQQGLHIANPLHSAQFHVKNTLICKYFSTICLNPCLNTTISLPKSFLSSKLYTCIPCPCLLYYMFVWWLAQYRLYSAHKMTVRPSILC